MNEMVHLLPIFPQDCPGVGRTGQTSSLRALHRTVGKACEKKEAATAKDDRRGGRKEGGSDGERTDVV